MAIVLENVDQIKDSKGNVLDIAAGISGGGAEEFVATGNIADGQLVGLKADGTIEIIAGTASTQAESTGSPEVFSGSLESIATIFDSNSNKVVIAYRDHSNSNYGTARVGTVSGSTITFGSPKFFSESIVSFVAIAFDSNVNRVVIAFSDSGNNSYPTAVVGEVSGTNITFGAKKVFHSGCDGGHISAAFDSNSNKVVIAYKHHNDSQKGKAVVGTVDAGTNGINFGSPYLFESLGVEYTSTVFDTSQNKVVIAYRCIGNSGYGRAVVGTVGSNDTISFGAPFVFKSSSVNYTSSAYDSFNEKVVIAYGNVGEAVVGTVSGNTISFGTPVSFFSNTEYPSVVFDSNSNKIVIAYRGLNQHGYIVSGIVSEESLILDSPVVYENATINMNSAVFNSIDKKVVVAYRDYGNSSYGTAIVYAPYYLNVITNAPSWLGIADEAITSGDSGKISMVGSVVDGLTGLTPNAKYYVNYDGTLTDTENAGVENGTYGEIGTALSSTSLLITRTNEGV